MHSQICYGLLFVSMPFSFTNSSAPPPSITPPFNFCPDFSRNNSLARLDGRDECGEEEGTNGTTGGPGGGGGRAEATQWAFYILVLGQIVGGVGSSGLHTLVLAYIDENSPASKSAMYIGNH